MSISTFTALDSLIHFVGFSKDQVDEPSICWSKGFEDVLAGNTRVCSDIQHSNFVRVDLRGRLCQQYCEHRLPSTRSDLLIAVEL